MSSAIPIPSTSSFKNKHTKSTSLSSLPSPSPSSSTTSTSTSSPRSNFQQSQQRSPPQHKRRPSLLSSSLQKQEHTVFDLGIRDGTTRIVTCVKTAQGFDWNQEMFLPHHLTGGSGNGSDVVQSLMGERADVVHEIVLDDDGDSSDDGLDMEGVREGR